MFWALLFGTLIAIFNSSGESIFLSPKGKQIIKSNVKSNPQKKEIFQLIKSYEKETKKIAKTQKGKWKEIEAHLRNKSSESKDIEIAFAAQLDLIQERQEEYISKSLEVKKLVSPEEWENIVLEFETQHKKLVKKQEKQRNSLDKVNKKLIAQIQKTIVDDSARQQAIERIDQFVVDEKKHWKIIHKVNYQDVQELKQKNISREELEQISNEINESWEGYFELITRFHHQLSELTTEQEWKSISKKIKLHY